MKGPPLRRPYWCSDQLRCPHKHSNMRIVLPVVGSSIVRTRYGTSPQRSQFRIGCDLGAVGAAADPSPSLMSLLHGIISVAAYTGSKGSRKSSSWLRPYFGGCNPGKLTHSSIWDAVSACRARLSRASLSGLGRSSEAFAFSSSANEARRSLREVVCLNRRRCMTQPREVQLGLVSRAGTSSRPETLSIVGKQ